MPLKIPRPLVEFILLGPEDDRRQLQDSPILGDVWAEFAKFPNEQLELLITPDREQPASYVARALSKTIPKDRTPQRSRNEPTSGPDDQAADGVVRGGLGTTKIAYLQGIVAVRLTFEELIRFVLPMTFWWAEPRIEQAMQDYLEDRETLAAEVIATCEEAEKWLKVGPQADVQDFETRRRFSVLTAVLLWAAGQDDDAESGTRSGKDQSAEVVRRMKEASDEIARNFVAVVKARAPKTEKPLVWTISLNRRATAALTRSVPAVKADAARTLFKVDCSQIIWAILDSGIDATHYAFGSPKRHPKTGQPVVRVKRSFDFTAIREIVTLDNLDKEHREGQVKSLRARGLGLTLPPAQVDEALRMLGDAAEMGGGINWSLVEQLVEIDPMAEANRPKLKHGTHVAGILAASQEGAYEASKATRERAQANGQKPEAPLVGTDWADGICPDIGLYDLRVLAPSLQETEFAIIAALQYIRFVNERYSYMTIHGANLSLSIPHDVRNFACGRTPICNECERLVNSGVVVVAAAGNRGYQNFETKDGLYEGYAAFSVTDPGNADGVITVGATHRYWPHTYGVSFFSSRGPTGDGRLKPDLVAPGEKIRGPLPRNAWGDLDGTSMAAPHVSGAAAMLMARYSELVGQPRRIKEILCKSATDLGRERSFQGHGMLDVLRAFQSI